jgi:hypothetical protein
LAAKRFSDEFIAAFAAKCAINGMALMQDAIIGGWNRESHLSAEHLKSMHDLNQRFLDLSGCAEHGPEEAPRVVLAGQLAPLSQAQRAAAANCPYALFDMRFGDESHWSARLQSGASWQVADDVKIDDELLAFVRLALFFAWHLAAGAGPAPQLLLGMHADTVRAFRRTALNSLPSLAVSEARHLKPRWNDCLPYWSALIGAAAGADEGRLRRVQLYGLQLSAAARLPNP